MSEEDRHAAYIERRKRIRAAQRAMDAALAGDEDVAAGIRANVKPLVARMDIGYRDDPDDVDLKKVPRFN